MRALKEDEDEDKEDKEHPENAIEPVIFSLNENSKRIKLADAARWLGWTVLDWNTRMVVGKVVQILATSGGEIEVEVEGETSSEDALEFLEALSFGMMSNSSVVEANKKEDAGEDADESGSVARISRRIRCSCIKKATWTTTTTTTQTTIATGNTFRLHLRCSRK